MNRIEPPQRTSNRRDTAMNDEDPRSSAHYYFLELDDHWDNRIEPNDPYLKTARIDERQHKKTQWMLGMLAEKIQKGQPLLARELVKASLHDFAEDDDAYRHLTASYKGNSFLSPTEILDGLQDIEGYRRTLLLEINEWRSVERMRAVLRTVEPQTYEFPTAAICMIRTVRDRIKQALDHIHIDQSLRSYLQCIDHDYHNQQNTLESRLLNSMDRGILHIN